MQLLNNRSQFRFQRSFAGVLSCTKDTVFTRKSAASSQQQYVAWDRAPQWRKKTKNRLKQQKKKYIGERGKLNRGLGRRKGPRLPPSSLRSPIFFSSFFPNAEPPGQTIRRMRIFNFNLVNPKIIIRLILLDGC